MGRLVILHVEDNDADAGLLAHACKTSSLPVDLHRVVSGLQAVAYLKGEGDYADRTHHPLPQVIILDLKLPGMDGFEFLGWLRRESDQRSTPVLVFTESFSAADKARAMARGATGFYLKAAGFDALIESKLLGEQMDEKSG